MVTSIRQSAAATFGLVVLTVILVLGALGPLVTPYDPTAQNLTGRLEAPTWMAGRHGAHFLGTDQLGRDILSRLIAGSRVTLLVALVAVLAGGTLGCTLGILAGYYRGVTERVIMRVTDVQLAFPFILLALIIIAVLGPSLVNLILVLAFTSWVDYARVIRAQVLSLREREFVEAARAIGVRDIRLLSRHILPNMYTVIIVVATLQLARVVILEASLSFLGLGVQPPTPSWGRMLAEGRDFVATAWWLAAFPGLAILLLVLSASLVGDWLAVYFNPRLRRAGG